MSQKLKRKGVCSLNRMDGVYGRLCVCVGTGYPTVLRDGEVGGISRAPRMAQNVFSGSEGPGPGPQKTGSDGGQKDSSLPSRIPGACGVQ